MPRISAAKDLKLGDLLTREILCLPTRSLLLEKLCLLVKSGMSELKAACPGCGEVQLIGLRKDGRDFPNFGIAASS